MSEVQSSSPVAAHPLDGNGQWMVIVGHAFDGGFYVVGPFASEELAEAWSEDNSNGTVTQCLAPERTILDRCGYPLHLQDAARS